MTFGNGLSPVEPSSIDRENCVDCDYLNWSWGLQKTSAETVQDKVFVMVVTLGCRTENCVDCDYLNWEWDLQKTSAETVQDIVFAMVVTLWCRTKNTVMTSSQLCDHITYLLR